MKNNISDPKVQHINRALKKLEKDWPNGLWLYAANGTLNLMTTHDDGSIQKPGNDGVDHDLVVQSYSKIQCDGGDW